MPDADESKLNARMFEALLQPILKPAFGTAYHMTRNREEAEDLVQEAAVQAFRAYGTFQQGTNFKAWYFRILINLWRKKYRMRQHEPPTMPLDDAPNLYLFKQVARLGLHNQVENPAVTVLRKMSLEDIEAAVVTLPEPYQIIAVLYFIEEVSYQEIADRVGCPIGTVRSRLHRSRCLLQKALWQYAEERGIVTTLTENSVDSQCNP